MKLVSLQCPNCGASLKVEDNWGELCRCGHCDSSFILERPAPTINQTVHNYYGTAPQREKPLVPASQSVGMSIIVACVIAVVVIGFFLTALFSTATSNSVEWLVEVAEQEIRLEPESEPLRLFAAQAFDTGEQRETLEDLRYLQVSSDGRDRHVIAYSFQPYDPVTGQGAEHVRQMHIASSDSIEWLDFQCFTGLTALVIEEDSAVSYPYERDMQMLPLYDLRYYGAGQRAELALAALPNPENLTGLEVVLYQQEDVEALKSFAGLQTLRVNRISDEVENLQGLSALSNLETLVLRDGGEDISWLSAMTSVKDLTIERCYNITDYSVLSGMPGLESLELYRAENLKVMGFVSNMPNLRRLVITGSQVKDISPLSGKRSLTYLDLRDNKIEGYQPLETLTSLTQLHLYRGSGPLPDLSGLPLLEEVSITTGLLPMVEGCDKIHTLNLTLWDDVSLNRLSGMTSLETLTIIGDHYYIKDTRPLSALPNLRELTLDEGRYYNDAQAGSVFSVPGLEKLVVKGASFTYFDGGVVPQNQNLRVLELEKCGFFWLENSKTVKLPGSADQLFLAYPLLEELSVPNGELDDIGFAQALLSLRVLDISDNYVTDISPLAGLEQLEVLTITGNPVENLSLLTGRMQIIQ